MISYNSDEILPLDYKQMIAKTYKGFKNPKNFVTKSRI